MIIDHGKKRTLKRLADRKEAVHRFPIEKSDLLEINQCGLCGSKESSLITELYLLKEFNFFSRNTCNSCLYTFSSISPSFEWFKKCWKTIADDKLEIFNPAIEEIRKKRYETCFDFLFRFLKGKNVLEIGGAYGTGAKVFQDHGLNVHVIEPEYNKSRYIEKVLGISVVSESVEEFLFEDRKYDLINFAHCLEHLDNPFFVLSNVGNLLNPEGILYIEIPILWNYVTWNDAFYLTHKSNFTEQNLFNLVHKNHFEILDKGFFRHSEEESFDLGIILKKNEQAPKKYFEKQFALEDVKRQYRKNFPLREVPPLNTVLRYNVENIEHFYQTIRLDNKKLVSKHDMLNLVEIED